MYGIMIVLKRLSTCICNTKVKTYHILQECWVSPSTVLKALHPTSLGDVEDMISLGELSECSILHNLHLRYRKRVIYVSL